MLKKNPQPKLHKAPIIIFNSQNTHTQGRTLDRLLAKAADPDIFGVMAMAFHTTGLS
ncbi:hypothetical protein DCAR_0623981 [Daucus carota subsp. sativus]|uniref:Uncharacterized protein n=1 Tax=Daucus carota subsp. sativus TaxID=79200 RepID=A0A161ZRV6_DAUCS|nr:hypothetical protein DCAR_0623981 [Daucus carota subsp. sativus]